MFSVGNCDGRKGITLEFNVPRPMEETELEEGEAFSFQDDDPSIDPDTDLSYIDEKIHDVLGHFQKDFEGGVSAENLGPIFGGYGSFLPTYQRSPAWPHLRSPARAQNCIAHGSPANFRSESKGELASTRAAPLPALVLTCATDPAKGNACKPTNHAQEFHLRPKPPDPKTLKVRIKMGSDNLSARKNAEIYSGLGLDISPSSSLDDSPAEIEGFSHVPEAPDESPNAILQMMISSPLHGELLLSPLSDDLLNLSEEAFCLGSNKSRSLPVGIQDIPSIMGNVPVSAKNDEEVSDKKKTKPVGKNVFSLKTENESKKDVSKVIGVTFKRESEIYPLACEELVSNKLPLLANSCCSSGETAKSADKARGMLREASPGILKDKSFSDLTKTKLLEPMPAQEVSLAEKPNRKSVSSKNANSHNVASGSMWNDADYKAETNSDQINAVSKTTKGSKSLIPEPLGPSKLNQEFALGHDGKGLSSLGGRKKSKGSQHENSASDLPKENPRLDSSILSKKKLLKSKNTLANDHLPKKESDIFKTEKDFVKANYRQENFFGDMQLEEEEKKMRSSDLPKENLRHDPSMPSKKKLLKSKNTLANDHLPKKKSDVFNTAKDSGKANYRYEEFFGDMQLEEENRMKSFEKSPDDHVDSQVVGKCRSALDNGSKDKFGGKKVEKKSKLKKFLNATSNAAPISGNSHMSNASHVNGNGYKSPPIPVAADNWVLCDSCEKWRLLPVWSDPNDLPEKWLCSMLTCLPGMNRCSVSEEETKKAVLELDQISVPESQNNVHGNGDAVVTAANNTDAQTFGRNNQDPRSHPARSHSARSPSARSHSALTSGKKHKLKGTSADTSCDAHPQISYSMKNLQGAVKASSPDAMNMLPVKSKHDTPHVNGSSNLPSEKHRHKQKEKHQIPEQSSHGGDNKKLKLKSTKVVDQVFSSVREEIKTEGMPAADDLRYKRCSSKDPRHDADGNLPVSVGKQKNNNQVSMDGKSTDTVRLDAKGSAKNHKEKDCQDHKIYSGSFRSCSHLPQDKRGSVKLEADENDRGKKKKARLIKSEQRELNATKTNVTVGRKVDMGGSNMANTLPLRCADSSRKDLVSRQPSVIAASSSSMVSGSHKTKVNLHELKGSPVGSVSSSPFRNLDLTTSTSTKVSGNGDFCDGGVLAQGSPLRGSDGERDGRSDQSGLQIKGRNADFTHRRLPVSSVLDIKQKVHVTESHDHANELLPTKSRKGSSSQSWDDDLANELRACAFQDSGGAGTNKFHEKIGLKSDNVGKDSVVKRGTLSSENAMSTSNQNHLLDHDDERSSKRFRSSKMDRSEFISENATISHRHQLISVSQKGSGPNSLSFSGPKIQHMISRQPTPNGLQIREAGARSPSRRDSASQVVSSVLKEAKNLKHMADRQKNSGSNLESTRLYFEAALKFLHGAAILESCNCGGTDDADVLQSMEIYSETAKLCEFCAYEYEKFEDMAAAALAYKCMEVAYMRVVYSSHSTASRDRCELQHALQVVPPGESPSSSASDIDNLNNLTADKVTLVKGFSSHQVAGNHVIAAQHRPSFLRLLSFAQDVKSAMDASEKSRIAFTAVKANIADAQPMEGISSVKNALDYDFQDMEGLLRLVRLALEALSWG